MLCREGKSLNNFSLRIGPEEPEGGSGRSPPVGLGGKKWGREIEGGSAALIMKLSIKEREEEEQTVRRI